MVSFDKVALAACLVLASSMAQASERVDLDLDQAGADSLNSFAKRVLPVLVRVDGQGRVKEVEPAYRLSPGLNRALRSSIDEMVQGPALDAQGRNIPSQFILNLVLETSLQDDGNYQAGFRYASTQPVPSGSWGWEHIDGYRLALFDRSRVDRERITAPLNRSQYQRPSPPPPAVRPNPPPAAASASRPSSPTRT